MEPVHHPSSVGCSWHILLEVHAHCSSPISGLFVVYSSLKAITTVYLSSVICSWHILPKRTDHHPSRHHSSPSGYSRHILSEGNVHLSVGRAKIEFVPETSATPTPLGLPPPTLLFLVFDSFGCYASDKLESFLQKKIVLKKGTRSGKILWILVAQDTTLGC
ncbi:hypothetical protein CEXT_442101 [Caerostris extrusa]|uniref:Uncharacterized protein n=1 Tax=Caerostris extrusa TaxID=172846 RepID=A0AAV4XU31_CAEEX|nr:hypothetical protein CEXT_442101 [Caerostris extrusa]